MIAILHRWKPSAVLALSLGLYVAALLFQINFRTWPAEGYWYFDPFTWQCICPRLDWRRTMALALWSGATSGVARDRPCLSHPRVWSCDDRF